MKILLLTLVAFIFIIAVVAFFTTLVKILFTAIKVVFVASMGIWKGLIWLFILFLIAAALNS